MQVLIPELVCQAFLCVKILGNANQPVRLEERSETQDERIRARNLALGTKRRLIDFLAIACP